LFLLGCSEHESRTIKKIGRVNDYAGVLSNETKMSLSSDLEEYEKETCHQIVVLIVQSLRGETIKELSTRIALEWEIVNPILENGIMLSIAIDEGKARIEMGTAMEDIIEEGIAEDIMLKEMIPSFSAQDFDKGIVQGIRAIKDEARRFSVPDEMRPAVCK